MNNNVLEVTALLLQWLQDIYSGEIICHEPDYTQERCITAPLSFNDAVRLLKSINGILKIAGAKYIVYFLTPTNEEITTWEWIRTG